MHLLYDKIAYVKQGNRGLHFAALCTPVTPFSPIGDAAYRQHTGGGPSYGHKQHAREVDKDLACGSEDILADRQTDTQTDILITILRNRSRGRSKHVRTFQKLTYVPYIG